MADRSSREVDTPRKPLWLKLGLVGLVLIAVAVVMKVKDMDAPPEMYTQADVYEPMEAGAADAVGALPDFPGFEQRTWGELPCSRNGEVDPDYTDVEIRYRMSAAASAEDRTGGRYVELLRDHWTSLGYEVTYEDEAERADGSVARDLAVKREDGMTLWYSAAGYASL